MRRLFAIVLVLTVFLPSIAFARATFLCLVDGKTRTHCCCEKKADDRPTSVEAASCCKATPAPPAAMVAPATTAAARDQADAIMTVLATPVAVTVASSRVVVRAAIESRATAPPEPDAALFVRHCALLL